MKTPHILAISSFAVHGTASLKTFITILGEKILPVPSLMLNGLTNMALVKKLDIHFKELLESYVKPAVEMDGGAIQFKSYEDGKVNLMLQGSCSGCPSSMITLKAGIEGMMKRMIPEVKEVVAEAE